MLIDKFKYFLVNPKYTYLYFFGTPASVFQSITGQPASRFTELRKELEAQVDFQRALEERTRRFTDEPFSLIDDHYFLYAMVRVLRPRLILETGVFDGHFTACFLKGLEQNALLDGHEGRLASIDLPAYEPITSSTNRMVRTHLPGGCEPGWVIPPELQERWELHLGDSRELLPTVGAGLEEIDIFFHDSLHTYDHMTFEFETIWPQIREGAVLMSHDVHWNRAFADFVKSNRQREYVTHGFGVVRRQR